MNFVKEVLREAAKRRGMSYEGLLNYIRGERTAQGMSAGMGETNKKEVNQTMDNQAKDIPEITAELSQEMQEGEQVDTAKNETAIANKTQEQADAVQIGMQKEIAEEAPKTTGTIGNFGKPLLLGQEDGSLGTRLGRMAQNQVSNHNYFK